MLAGSHAKAHNLLTDPSNFPRELNHYAARTGAIVQATPMSAARGRFPVQPRVKVL
jgi:hypothetical protein